MELTAVEIRVLGALIEKDRSTPDSYPLSTNALVAACNQKTSRDPVMSLTSAEVDTALLELRQQELARTVKETGSRSYKHRHVFQDAIGVDDQQLAVLAVLMLRGAQTSGELRTRTERYVSFVDVDDVERTLGHLASRQDPLVRNLGRGPGQSQDRWVQLLADDSGVATPPSPVVATPPVAAVDSAVPAPASGGLAQSGSTAGLRAEVAELRRLVENLYAQLGVDLDASTAAAEHEDE